MIPPRCLLKLLLGRRDQSAEPAEDPLLGCHSWVKGKKYLAVEPVRNCGGQLFQGCASFNSAGTMKLSYWINTKTPIRVP